MIEYPEVECPVCKLKHNQNNMFDYCEEHMLDLIFGKADDTEAVKAGKKWIDDKLASEAGESDE